MWFLMLALVYALTAAPIVSGVRGVTLSIPNLSLLISLTITFLAVCIGRHTVKVICGKLTEGTMRTGESQIGN